MEKTDMHVNIGGILFKNPVTTASGTFGHGTEYEKYLDLNRLGAITVKGVTLYPKKGNPPPRVAETASGVLNSVGLQNPGVYDFIRHDLNDLKKYSAPIIVNIAGEAIEEYVKIASILDSTDVSGLEINVSCPNVEKGGMTYGTDPDRIYSLTKRIRKITNKTVIVKLSPNVTDIVSCAKASKEGGADAVSMINTLLGMAIDAETARPCLKNITGGLSGPAIKPVALRMVYEVHKNVDIPIIGMGGILSGSDAVEFMLAGASAVAVGTANFINPRATIDVIDGIKGYMARHRISSVNQLIGALRI